MDNETDNKITCPNPNLMLGGYKTGPHSEITLLDLFALAYIFQGYKHKTERFSSAYEMASLVLKEREKYVK